MDVKQGFSRQKPTAPRHRVLWDAKVVVNYLKNLGTNSELYLEQLIYKTVSLLAMATAQRVQSIHLLNLEQLIYKTVSLLAMATAQRVQSIHLLNLAEMKRLRAVSFSD